jgi:hypothetical protein
MQKDIDWRDEREYRIVIWNKRENDNYDNKIVKINGALKAVILGLNNNDKEIINIAKTKKIRVYKLEFDNRILLDEIY